MLDKSGDGRQPHLVPNLSWDFSNISIRYDIDCGFATYYLYYVEVCSFKIKLIQGFYFEWILNVANAFSLSTEMII